MNFQTFKDERDKLRALMEAASRKMKELAGTARGPIGLTPDSIKFSADYQSAEREFQAVFQSLRRLNSQHAKRFKRETVQEISEKRTALAAAGAIIPG